MLSNFIFTLFIQIVLVKSNFLFSDDSLQDGDQCQFNYTHTGICSDNCPPTVEDNTNMGFVPKLCSLSDGNVLYCCLENPQSETFLENQTDLNKLAAYKNDGIENKADNDDSDDSDTSFSIFENFNVCRYNDTIDGVCRSKCSNLKFPKYKLLITEKKHCIENGVKKQCCVNHLQIAYAPEIFNLSNTFEEGDFCPYNDTSIGICETWCQEDYSSFSDNVFTTRKPICNHQSDGTPIYCCNDYYTSYPALQEVVPYASENDNCKHEGVKIGLCKVECKKLEKLQKFGKIPTMCPHETGKQPLYCCPFLNEDDELEKYRNRSSGRTFYKKCEEYRKRRFYRRKRRIHSINPTYYVPFYTGGTDVWYGEFPHMAAIGWTKMDGNIEWRCGGSLISDDYVMTAAHCIIYNGIPPDAIRIGDQYLDIIEDENNLPQDFKIDKIIKHPKYSYFATYNDIALLKLNQSITPTSIVHPACLWNDNDNIDDELVTLSMGYGSTEFGGANARKLIKGNLTRYSHEDCVQIYKKIHNPSLKYGIFDTQLCAGDPNGVQDTCGGDSGGPLQYKIKYGHYIYGITSVGQNCPSSVPGIYTKVSKYLDWIESIVWPNKWTKY